tara:strand:- start:69 stop:419 length:351 start_codon:yes stop_codon:yes gene_type:complete
MNIEELEQKIIQWGIDRNLIGPTGEATKAGQQKKTEEEVRELYDAIRIVDFGFTEYQEEEANPDVRDAIGDIIVTLVMQAQMWGLTLTECITAAWNEIKDRRGKMIGGVFVKESKP